MIQHVSLSGNFAIQDGRQTNHLFCQMFTCFLIIRANKNGIPVLIQCTLITHCIWQCTLLDPLGYPTWGIQESGYSGMNELKSALNKNKNPFSSNNNFYI